MKRDVAGSADGGNRLPSGPDRWQGMAVTSTRELRNLALVGFMGAGKSTVGRMVSRELGLSFVDTDEAIEASSGRRVAEIFQTDGEPAFRGLEREVVKELVCRDGLVLATGGGLVCQPGNMDLLKSRCLVVCLWASPDTIWERVRHQTHRPLLQVADPRMEVVRLMAVREPFYRQSDILVNSGLRSLREVAMQVAHQFKSMRQANGHSRATERLNE